MTYREEIVMLVQNQVGTGKTLKEIVEPLLNMAASAMVNIVHHNNLDLDNEKDVLHAMIDLHVDTYQEKYLELPTIN